MRNTRDMFKGFAWGSVLGLLGLYAVHNALPNAINAELQKPAPQRIERAEVIHDGYNKYQQFIAANDFAAAPINISQQVRK